MQRHPDESEQKRDESTSDAIAPEALIAANATSAEAMPALVDAIAGDATGTELNPSLKKKQTIWTVGTLVYTASGVGLLFAWLLWGDFALSMRDRSVGQLVEKFLLVQGASNFVKTMLTSFLPTTIALILTPIISYRSDRTRSRWGRRIPYLLIPTPIAGLAMIGIAFCPQLGVLFYQLMGNSPAPGVTLTAAASTHTLSIFTVFWVIFEVTYYISLAIMGGLINDVVPRSLLGRFHGLFRAVSLYDGILFNTMIFKHAESHFTLMFALIGVLFGGGFTLMCLKVKEGEYPPPEPVEPDVSEAGSAAHEPGATLSYARPMTQIARSFVMKFYRASLIYFKECFSKPYYLLCFAIFALGAVTFIPLNQFDFRYAKQLKMADGDYGFLRGISYIMSLVLAFPLGMLVDRFHPIRMTFFSIVLYGMTVAYGALFVHDVATFSIALVAHTILSGTFFTCFASLAQQLLPKAKFSQYLSASSVVQSLATLALAPAIGFLLDLSNRTVTTNGVAETTSDFHLTYWFGLGLAVTTIVLMMLLLKLWNSYGGIRGYVAPGDEDLTPAPYAPPAHLIQILLVYAGGALIGVAAGYVLGFMIHPAAVKAAGVKLFTFHHLIVANKDVRDTTSFCIATGVIPFAILGGWIGSQWAKRKGGATAGH